MRKQTSIVLILLLTGCNTLVLDKVPIKDIIVKESSKTSGSKGEY
jgi:hypothetical protein